MSRAVEAKGFSNEVLIFLKKNSEWAGHNFHHFFSVFSNSRCRVARWRCKNFQAQLKSFDMAKHRFANARTHV